MHAGTPVVVGKQCWAVVQTAPGFIGSQLAGPPVLELLVLDDALLAELVNDALLVELVDDALLAELLELVDVPLDEALLAELPELVDVPLDEALLAELPELVDVPLDVVLALVELLDDPPEALLAEPPEPP